MTVKVYINRKDTSAPNIVVNGNIVVVETLNEYNILRRIKSVELEGISHCG